MALVDPEDPQGPRLLGGLLGGLPDPLGLSGNPNRAESRHLNLGPSVHFPTKSTELINLMLLPQTNVNVHRYQTYSLRKTSA